MWSSRRKFLTDSVYLSGGVLFSQPLLTSFRTTDAPRVTILHTNDTHSHIDPFPDNDARYPGQGGVSRRANLVQKIRSEEENVLLLDAGDIFQGTPYFNQYGGVLEMKLMTELAYDAATMGNHDFDAGMEGFSNARKHAKFPFLCANYDFSNTILHNQTQPNIVFKKGGVKIGVFGVGIKLHGLVPKSKYEDTLYLDPVGVAQEQVRILQKKKCDLIICLSHLGYDYEKKTALSDLVLAQNTEGIHLIIGGHTHTFLGAPTQATNRIGETVLINQVGWAGLQLGRVDFSFDKGWKAQNKLIHVI